jgi:Ca-activated chloride channel family protein
VRLKAAFLLLAGLLAATQTIAADKTMIVLDASGSMWGDIAPKEKPATVKAGERSEVTVE